MKFNVLEELEFIPKWRGNHKDDQPAKFIIQPLNKTELSRAQQTYTINGKFKIDFDYEYIFEHGVKSVDNLRVNNTVNLKPADWVKVKGIGGLIDEVAIEILRISRIDEEDKKK